MPGQLQKTLVELVGVPSTSGNEGQVREYLISQLNELELEHEVDAEGNLICTLSGEGEPLLLSAHMDRVPPGLGHRPVLRNDVLYSDGTTNLGADDAAGVAVVLEALNQIMEQQIPHPPLVAVFTVKAESGHQGARNLDVSRHHVSQGLVFDDGFEAGVVISQGPAYDAFDVTIRGRPGHSGRNSNGAVDAIEIFRQTDYPTGSFAQDQTRIQLGTITAGNERNVIASELHIEGELRSFESAEARGVYKSMISEAFDQAARRLGGTVEVSFTPGFPEYSIALDEPLLEVYQSVLAQRSASVDLRPSFIGGDTAVFRPRIKAFTISTGVINEHSFEESIAIIPLEQVLQDTLELLRKLRQC